MTKIMIRVICAFLVINTVFVLSAYQNLLAHTRDSENNLRRQVTITSRPSQALIAGWYFKNTLQHNLSNFQLDELGITETTMREVTQRDDFEYRTTNLVNEVWLEWYELGVRPNGFDIFLTSPSYETHQLSPFRQLAIRMIQGKQQTLSDSQQHALFNYFTRQESAESWATDMDGIIGAVNRESLLWP